MTARFDRRSFLRRGGIVLGAASATGPLSAFMSNPALASVPADQVTDFRSPNNGGYGQLSPTPDLATGAMLLALPAGFEYVSFGRTGEPGSDGFPTPSRHDGMAAFAGDDDGVVRLVRNHERGYAPTPLGGTGEEPLVGDPSRAYDRNSGGGCTTVTFDMATFRMTDSYISINGTSVNCAGGPTPWGSWLTCEETTNGTQSQFSIEDDGPIDPTLVYEKNHGYVFEVPSAGGPVQTPQPLTAMGRFSHEAVAIDPASGIVYETEDANPAGFYRFVPDNAEDLAAGGTLQMLAVRDRPNYDTRFNQSIGAKLSVTWVDIADPDPAYPTTSEGALGSLVFRQGFDGGGAVFSRLEGCWYGNGSIFVNSTDGGNAEVGQVWEYKPRGTDSGILELIFESPSAAVLDSPDNLTVSPRGGVVLCEDGSDDQYVRGLDMDGRIFDFALNIISDTDRDKEFAGATFSPDGSVLFVNVQTPGISFAIRGPWENGDI